MSTSDYARVEQAIRFLDVNARRQPSLGEVAAHIGLSEAHFQRLFTRWAGVSPKRFLQFQTVEHAKRLLRESRSVLDASWDAGLSGGGRLHDLFVAAEALTPGEYKRGGTGLEIAWGVHPTPFGDAFIAVTTRGICALSFLPEAEERRPAVERAAAELAAEWPEATLRHDPSATRPHAARAFAPLSETRLARPGEQPASLGVVLKGTNFQLQVWRALLQVPAGAVTTYEELAAAAGAPGAVRAVGSALARNAVAYLIPCHRVIRKTGAFGQYRWGPERKRAMLLWESERAAVAAAS